MYIALCDIDEYKKGDVVPDELGVVWKEMYAIPPVEKVEGEVKKHKKSDELDLNKDGVIDGKDASIASKVMHAMRKKKHKRSK